MPKSSKPRKKYNLAKRRVALNAHEMAVESMTSMADHGTYFMELKIKNHMAMYNLTHGQATRHDMDSLIAMANIMESFKLMDVCAPLADEINAAQDAIYDIVMRSVDKLAYVARGPEIVALNTLMELHDEMMPAITLKQMEQAIEFAKKLCARKPARRLPLPKELA